MSYQSTSQTNCITGKGHNLYGIDIPFQFDGRDGTMTATYGDATPQVLVLQVHSSSRISIGNLAPILAPKVLCCYVNGHGEEATCPADGGPEEECPAGEGDCGDSVGSCDYDRCEILFENSDSTELKHDYEPSEYNCTLIDCCFNLYKSSLMRYFEKLEGFFEPLPPVKISPTDEDEGPYIYFYTASDRECSLGNWHYNNNKECEKWLKNN
jgi:hypothetical protein